MAKKTAIELLLVRSGRTNWEDEGRLQGHADLPMSESGRGAILANLTHLMGASQGLELDLILSAPDEASRETADLLAERTGARLRVADGLAALSLGLWEGLLEEQLVERYAKAYKQWREDPGSVNPPEGEGFVAGQVRLLTAAGKGLEKQGGKSVGMVLRPLEYGLMRAVVHEKPTGELWTLVEDGPLSEMVTVTPKVIKDRLEALKARA